MTQAAVLPHDDTETPAPPEAAPKEDRLAGWLILGQIIGATFLQKFAVPFGETQLYLSFFLMIALTGLGLLSGRMIVRTKAFAAYMLMAGVLTLTQIFGGAIFSFPSFALFLSMHFFYIFGLKQDNFERERQFSFFQKIICFCAGLGILQFLLQFVIGPDNAFFIDTMLPESIVQKGFHEMNPVKANSTIYKSTGFFFLEPAVFCQFLAIGLIIEMVYFRKIWRILLLLVGIIMTFSGTGLITLFLLAPIYLLQHRRFIILFAGIALLFSAPLWAPAVGLGKMIDRATEFNNPHSSGYARFLSILPTLDTYVLKENNSTLFGLGAGSILKVLGSQTRDYEAHNPSWGKMLFEYGIIGGLTYFIFMGYLFWISQGSAYIKIAIFLTFMILGEYILTPTIHGLILALLLWPPLYQKSLKGSQQL